MVVRGVIFDKDGVLLDSEKVNIESGVRILKEHGIEATAEDRESIHGRHGAYYLPEFKEKYRITVPFDELDNRHSDIYYALWDEIAELLPGARQAVEYCKGHGLATCLVTSGGMRSTSKFFERFDFDLFEHTVTYEDVEHHKPAPDSYEKAAELLGIPKNQLLVVEDSLPGVQAAKAAGIQVVAVGDHDGAREKADYRIADLTQLPKLIESLEDTK